MRPTRLPLPKKPPVENFKAFRQRMESFFPHAQVIRAVVFYKLLKNEFRAYFRKSEKNDDGSFVRYLEHLRRVYLILLEEVGLIDFDTLMAALGHDAPEDTEMGLEEVTLVCGETTSKTIALCSKTPKQNFIRRLHLMATWRVLMVKLADRIDNLRTMGDSLEFIDKTLEETRTEYFTLARLLVERTPQEFQPQAQALSALLTSTYSEQVQRRGELAHTVLSKKVRVLKPKPVKAAKKVAA